MDGQPDWPITGVVIVAEAPKCPPGYTIIDKTYDHKEEADLWRDGLFGRRITRFMCVERCSPTPGKDVLVDVAIINERDPIPAGFTVLDYTYDSREKSIKKKVLCLRWMSCNVTNDAISELILLTRGARRPPNGYTMVGDLNNMMLCYKMSLIRTPQVAQTTPLGNSYNMQDVKSNLPYAVHPSSWQQNQENQPTSPVGTGLRRALHERSMSSLSSAAVTPLSGVPWQLCEKLRSGDNLHNLRIPEIRYKTQMDIERQYEYKFDVERSAKLGSTIMNSH